MFDIGWTELLVVAVVAVLVVGPKDLPRMLRTFGQTMGNLRRMANEFQGQFSDALREAERQVDLGDLKKSVSDLADLDPLSDIKKEIDTTQSTLNEHSIMQTDPLPDTTTDSSIGEIPGESDEPGSDDIGGDKAPQDGSVDAGAVSDDGDKQDVAGEPKGDDSDTATVSAKQANA